VVKQAALLCKRIQQVYLAHKDKGNGEPVTIADYTAQAILCKSIKEHFPSEGIIAEETSTQFKTILSDAQRNEVCQHLGTVLGHTPSQNEVANWIDTTQTSRTCPYQWVVDPLDGTKGYIQNKSYVIAVARLYNFQPILGIIGAPQLVHGSQKGALLSTIDDSAYSEGLFSETTMTELSVSKLDLPRKLRCVASPESDDVARQLLYDVLADLSIPSENLSFVDGQEKHARVASGHTDLFLRLPRLNSDRPYMIWDYAAGIALVNRAGGKITDIDGSPLILSKNLELKNKGVIATNGHIHPLVIANLSKILK
jgi:3'(2'), 5'-bisphosphate nucleotidase